MASDSLTPQDLLGRGWALPVRLGADGHLVELVSGPEAVAQSIWTILATAPGERVGQPQFGCGIHELVFAPGGAGTAALVAEQVRDALELWEPRIELLGVHVESVPAQFLLTIRVDYRLRAAPGVHNLVFPFYLEGSA
jgi:phage baseplate assembly protein W